jgi:predicted DsbA family dithiol-disulfide isomerase
MKVEIWSDVMCPFCYIGKRKFENALEQFSHKDEVEIEWKSFQLNPSMKTEPGKNINQYLAEIKGWTIDRAKEMNAHVSKMAEEVGLHYDFDKAIVANSFDAHRLIQLAKKKGKGNEAEENLFKAYFIEGKNIADHATLIELGNDIGLDAEEIKKMLSGNNFAEDVKHDVHEAEELGVRGVPFFVMDRKFGVSGAQAEEAFLNALGKAWESGK